MQFTVGGEEYDLTKERVITAIRGVPSEPVRKCFVEIEGAVFPPKQVFATVTGRARTSFTTMEAQRVLRRLGFVCREAGRLYSDTSTSAGARDEESASSVDARLAALEAGVGALQAAVAGLHARVAEVEGAG